MPQPRSDSVLNTGLSSAVSRKLEAERAREMKERAHQRGQLTPGAEIVIAWIDKELKEVMDLEYMVMHLTTEKDIKAQLLARKLHADFLKGLKARAKNMLREVQKAERTADKDHPWAQEANHG